MKRSIKQLIITVPIMLSLAAPAFATGIARTGGSGGNEGARLANIKAKGDAEITRRLTTLSTLSDKISGAATLTASDKSTLDNEVATETSGLTSLKTKLDAETTASGAAADVSSMITEYRVYALLVPKVQLVRVADDQQAAETKLGTLITKFQNRITAAKSQGKEVAALEAALNDMQAKLAAAQAISPSVQRKVLTLQPSDYNSDHSLLSGYRDQLKTAHADNQAAYTDAKTIVNDLKRL